MTLTHNCKLPSYQVLITSRNGVRREIERRRSPKALKKLEAIYDELTFIIQST